MKTKLGISVTMMAVVAYLSGLFYGATPLILIVGYVLINETDEWLRKSVVKALVVTLAFSLMDRVVGLIPNGITVLNNLFGIFNGYFRMVLLSKMVNFVDALLTLTEKLLMLWLAALALGHKTIKLPVIDKLLEIHM